ncbi:hypothetical protein GJ744_010727 [Endocarpon pusillum]|uniref:Prenylcysteine lyase domain-containing protein n=1 Tax=Endocarpon pusillum TaxID=364733 RepID=A0A8H7AE75_9EURO|nr:hypothetical protein GJ744_010727 [Endocarpon pusillum]
MTFTLQPRWLVALLALTSISPHTAAFQPDLQQQPFRISSASQPLGPTTYVKAQRVAIIGAGAAGSSTAYHLQQYAANATIPLDITIFEASSRIGGRTMTVNALDDPRYPAELGASIFVSVNRILVDAAEEFNLEALEAGADRPSESKYEIGIWDGKEFVYKSMNDDLGFLNMVKLFWRYGLAPLKTQRLMKSTVAKFLKMYDEPQFPWKSLTDMATRVGLLGTTASTGWQFLKSNGVGERFGNEIIQASTRVNYGQNLGLIHGLETMVCMATDGAMAVEGGNWRIFDGMVKKSRAHLRLNTSVDEITRLEEGGYQLSLSKKERHGVCTQTEDRFDSVILAAPFQYTGIKVSPALPHQPDEIPYVTLHVTLLVSPHRLSPKFFSTPTSPLADQDFDSIPEIVITTLPADLDLGSSPDGVGPTKVWSVSTLRSIPVNGSTQYLYKIFSPQPVNATFLSRLLDFSLGAKEDGNDSVDNVDKRHVSWSYEKKWHSYPYEYPRVTFEDLNLDAKGLWYTSGIESFISTMETSALMGKNVAKLIVNELVEKSGSDLN